MTRKEYGGKVNGPSQTTNLEADPSIDVVAQDFVNLADQLL